MEAEPIRPGLWRWAAPHPEWRPEKGGPGGWEQSVGCVYLEAPAAAAEGVILMDPLAPPAGTSEAERFWRALDSDVSRIGRPVAVLLTGFYHQRSATEIVERYGGSPGSSLWIPEVARHRLSCGSARAFGEGEPLPGGLEARVIEGPELPEVALFIPRHRALVVADALIGAGNGRARLAPPSWAEQTPEGAARYQGPYRESVRRLLDLPVEILLVSHGEPVLEAGREAIAEALASPAWGQG